MDQSINKDLGKTGRAGRRPSPDDFANWRPVVAAMIVNYLTVKWRGEDDRDYLLHESLQQTRPFVWEG